MLAMNKSAGTAVSRRPFCQPTSTQMVPGLPARTLTVSKAQGDDKDWDAAWSSFKKQMNAQVETKTESRPPPPRQAAPRGLSPEQNRLRAQERVLVDLWSSEDFFKLGVVGAFGLLVVFLVLAGPPPSDGRCTLPWC